MDIKSLGKADAIEAVESSESMEEIRDIAKQMNIGFSGNSGIDTIKGKILDVLEDWPDSEPEDLKDVDGDFETNEPDLSQDNDHEEIEVAKKPRVKGKKTIDELLMMDPTKEEDPNIRRQIVRAKALKLTRVRITNLDPADASLNGAIITMYNKYIGKVAKYVPFGEEGASGYHIPQILLNHLKSQKYAMRREVKGGRFGVKQYKTTLVPKYSIEVLPPLTQKELADLAAAQSANQGS